MNEVEIRIGSRDETRQGVQQAESTVRSGMKRVGKAAAVGLGAAGAAAGGVFATGLAANMNIEVANDKLAAQLGLTTEEAKKAGEVAGEVYGNNWGGSIEEVNEAIKSVGTNLGDVGTMSKAELQGMTESALALAATFDVDVNSSTAAASALIKNGLAKDSTEAFDIITAGFQNGADKAEDFTDTLTEYSPQFKKLGFDGKYTLDLLSEGLKAGARDTDVIADGFKEFGLRAIDGSDATIQAFKDIGLNAKDTAKAIAGGGPAAQEATQKTLEALLSIKDPIKQNNAGVALFGTTWEDTVRTILPALANADGAIEKVDGSTKRMSDTLGDNAQAKVDTLKRSFEQWTQKMASSEGPLGAVVTGVGEFGGGAMAAGSQIGMMAVAMRGLNLAFLANPIGLVVAAVALLVGGLIVLYKKSDTAKAIIDGAFKGITTAVLTMVEIGLKGFKMLLNAWMVMAEGILAGAEKAFGWMPGLGDKIKGARQAFDGFKDGVNASLDAAIEKTQEWKNSVNGMPKSVRLKGDIRDLESKVRAAQGRLKSLPPSKQTKVRADISQLQARVAAAKKSLKSIQDEWVNIRVNKMVTTVMDQINGKASGGIIGAATGGARGGLVEVGERGRELVRLPFGSTVIPNGTTENLLRAGGTGGVRGMTITVRSGGSRLDDLLVEILRKAIRAQGGNVQFVLGKG